MKRFRRHLARDLRLALRQRGDLLLVVLFFGDRHPCDEANRRPDGGGAHLLNAADPGRPAGNLSALETDLATETKGKVDIAGPYRDGSPSSLAVVATLDLPALYGPSLGGPVRSGRVRRLK